MSADACETAETEESSEANEKTSFNKETGCWEPTAKAESPLLPEVMLTEVAAKKVLEIRKEENIEANYALRCSVIGGGCSGFSYDLFFDEIRETDRIFESHGVKIACDQMSLMYLLGTKIDYVEALSGAGFKFNNPNTKSTCGCGSSFSV